MIPINPLIDHLVIDTQNIHLLIDHIVQRTSALRGATVSICCQIEQKLTRLMVHKILRATRYKMIENERTHRNHGSRKCWTGHKELFCPINLTCQIFSANLFSKMSNLIAHSSPSKRCGLAVSAGDSRAKGVGFESHQIRHAEYSGISYNGTVITVNPL